MHSIQFLLPIAFIAVVSGASYSKRQQITFEDGTSTEIEGLWNVHRLQGVGEQNKRIVCYRANITKDGSKSFLEKQFKLSDGKKFKVVYYWVADERQGVSLTYYKINEDGSRGPKLCELASQTSGHIIKYTAVKPCQVETVANYEFLCVSKIKRLSEDDQKSLDTLCPPNNFLQLKTNC